MRKETDEGSETGEKKMESTRESTRRWEAESTFEQAVNDMRLIHLIEQLNVLRCATAFEMARSCSMKILQVRI